MSVILDGQERIDAEHSAQKDPVWEKVCRLSEEVLSIAKAQILVKLRFLDRAMFGLTPKVSEAHLLASDGKNFFYEPRYLLNWYRQDSTYVIRAWTHVLMHCLFRHMFVSEKQYRQLWDLSADIAAEGMCRELALPQLLTSPGQEERNLVLDSLSEKVRPLTAEKLMHYFRHNPPDGPSMQLYRDLFTVDSHDLWYERTEQEKDKKDPGGDQGDRQDGRGKEQKKEPQSQSEDQEEDKGENQGDDQEEEQGDDQGGDQEDDLGEDQEEDQDENQGDEQGEEDRQDQGEGQDSSGEEGENRENPGGGMSAEERQELESMWRDISERMQTDLETFARQRGFESGNMTQALRSLNRERYDYRAFLQKFAARTEVMRLSPDEFDYVFYTYGLSVYGDMPLIEPLEYREARRIRDIVIAIDTSGSCSGELVQQFLQKTYNILMQEETFDRRFCLHLIQCDATIQEDMVIHTREEFEEYIRHMTLKGFGGTDFRPVFSYVDQLRKQKALPNLQGLIYFTDGYGQYPPRQPDYLTAFVFLDDQDTGMHLVPPWAVKVVLETEDIRRM